MLKVAPRCAALEFPLKRPRGPALSRMPDAGVFQVQLPFYAPPGLVADFSLMIQVCDAGAFGVDELKLQRSIGV